MTTALKCPECGATDGIYARADLRWSAGRETWEIMTVEGDYDCTHCDHCAASEAFETQEQPA